MAGFYTVVSIPGHPSPCVKVVFPMPDGDATVILRPELDEGDAMRLVSAGRSTRPLSRRGP